MIVKGEITTINYTGNTCTVRMPIFESAAGGDAAITTATISNTPGVYNGYKEGDVVLVAFENGQLQNPVVIGKLYLGADAESKVARGSINCTTLVSENSNTLPLSTKIESRVQENTVEVNDTSTTFKTLGAVVEAVTRNSKAISNISESTLENNGYILEASKYLTVEPYYHKHPEEGKEPYIGDIERCIISKYKNTNTKKVKIVLDIERPGATKLIHKEIKIPVVEVTVANYWYSRQAEIYLNDYLNNSLVWQYFEMARPTLDNYAIQIIENSATPSKSATSTRLAYGFNGNGTIAATVKNNIDTQYGEPIVHLICGEVDNEYGGDIYLHDWHAKVVLYEK